MSLPKAVTSSTKTPGFYLRINLLAGAANPGTAALVGLLIGQKNAADGNITAQTEVRQCFGPDDVKTALGEGSPGHLAAIQMFRAFGKLKLYVVAPTASAGATATGTLTLSGTPTTRCDFVIDIAGRQIGTFSWSVGESVAAARGRLVSFINQMRPLPVIASAGGTGEVTLTAKSAGPWGNDITYGWKLLAGSGGAIASAAATLTGGTTEFNITTVLDLVKTKEYAAIGLATSNADATDNTTSSNAERLMTHIETYKEGLGALLQYGFVGHTGTITNVKAGAIGRNAVDMTYAFMQNAQSLPAELMGWELGDAMNWYSQRANYNRIGNRAPGIYGSKDEPADRLTFNESEDLLSNGVTPYDFAPNSTEIALVAPITTHSLDSASAPDYRAYYQSDTWGQNEIARYFRTALPQEFPNCSITEDLPPGDDELPPGVVERKDVYNFVLSGMRSFGRRGIADKVDLEASIADGSLAVEIDEDDTSQVNIFVPDKIVKPLAKFSAVFHKTG